MSGRAETGCGYALALLCAWTPACGDLPIGVESQPIVGGSSTGPGAFPATGMLLKGRRYRCTATLIAPDVAITAAHCLADTGFGGFALSLDRDLSDRVASDPVPISVYHRHPEYMSHDKPTDVAQVNDIAVLILDWPIEDVVPETLHTSNVPAPLTRGAELELCAYGVLGWYERSTVGIQRSAMVLLDRVADWELRIANTDPQPCQGDSGGPLFVETAVGRQIAGIVVRSVGETLHCDNGAIATRIDPYATWINAAALDRDVGCSTGGAARSTIPAALLIGLALVRTRRRRSPR